MASSDSLGTDESEESVSLHQGIEEARAVTILRIERQVDDLFSQDVHDLIRFRYCEKCRQIKPPRAHHCSICGRCVLRMDHHCPWVGNCVGHRSHKYFWNFLSSSFLGTTHVAVTMHMIDGIAGTTQGGFCSAMAAVLSLAFSVSIGLLLAFHTYLLLNNFTTLEIA